MTGDREQRHVEKDCQARTLNKEDAMDRSRWRKQIGMIDNHDRYEWVNVSSVIGSPGLSWTESKEPINSCVCVCVFISGLSSKL